MLVGVGIVVMAVSFHGSTSSPSLQTMCPNNTPELTQKTHFFLD